jgi:proteasome lid subunit RPN8/RPN11
MMQIRSTPRERLTIPRPLWRSLLAGLDQRGERRRESGAFLLSQIDRRRVEELVFFDDVDPDCLVGSIALGAAAFSRLWDHCAQAELRVVADAHTHPSSGVALSDVDRANPMIAVAGHTALVVPHYASHPVRRRDLGVHCFLGDAGWTSAFGRDAHRRVKLTRR